MRKPATACYYDLAPGLHRCDYEALRAHTSEARAELHCRERDRDAMIACCTRGSACSHEKIAHCYATLWHGELRGGCGAETDEIEYEISHCLEEVGWREAVRDP